MVHPPNPVLPLGRDKPDSPFGLVPAKR